MKIDKKWKEFAIANMLSDWEGEAAELYDKLMEADSSELAALFENHSIDIWEPFEYWEEVDVVDKIQDIAIAAQNTENSNASEIDTKLCVYLADYVSEEISRGVPLSDIDKYTFSDALEAYKGGAAYD